MTLRTELRPGDVGEIVRLHGVSYAREHGWDVTFEAYVAGPLTELACRRSPRERVWIAEREGRLVGCVAIAASSDDAAQLRWFLVDASCRGQGLGTRLLSEAISFSRSAGYCSIFLWTVRALTDAARLYTRAGFRLTEATPAHRWGADVVEERYDLKLD